MLFLMCTSVLSSLGYILLAACGRQMIESEKGAPQVGLRFKNLDEAWQFWVAYGGRMGFDVRKRYKNVSRYDGEVTSCRYVCSSEGYQRKKEIELIAKLEWLFHCIDVQEIMKSLMLCLNTATHSAC